MGSSSSDLFGYPIETENVVNVASVPQRSPFRYPGGKTWLIPQVRRWLQGLPPRPPKFIEPFAGGGSIGLTVAFENWADRVVMIELDEGVAAVWKTILGARSDHFVRRILDFPIGRDAVLETLSERASSQEDLAFQTLLRNRVQRGGILAPGASLVKNGENGRGVASRWYPQTLAKRIRAIQHCREKIEFHQGDAFDYLPRYLDDECAAFFIDPPYTAGGKRAGSRLYSHSQIDHEHLFAMMQKAHGQFLFTYDDASEVHALAGRYGFSTFRIPMSNTHHNLMFELLIVNSGEKAFQTSERQTSGVARVSRNRAPSITGPSVQARR